MNEKRFVFGHSAWDDGTYIVTIRPADEPRWRCMPIGMCLPMERAKEIGEWLDRCQNELFELVDKAE